MELSDKYKCNKIGFAIDISDFNKSKNYQKRDSKKQ